jgi:antitoxin (DNA-binding transcriptional repressor) of toxin-antitoxin stability system
MATIGLFEAKQRLSELVERARSGEDRAGKAYRCH